MKIAICDDNKYMATKIEEMILENPIQDLQCDIYSCGERMLNYMKQGNKYHLVFMDVALPGINGIDVAKRIRDYDRNALIVFVTQYREYVYKSFESRPFRFLTKPFVAHQIHKVLADAIECIHHDEQFFFFQSQRIHYQIPYSDILYFECHGRKIHMETEQESFEFYGRISEVWKSLDHTLFCRVHISYIVNMDAVRSIDDREVKLKNDSSIPISRSHQVSTKQAHINYISWRCGV